MTNYHNLTVNIIFTKVTSVTCCIASQVTCSSIKLCYERSISYDIANFRCCDHVPIVIHNSLKRMVQVGSKLTLTDLTLNSIHYHRRYFVN